MHLQFPFISEMVPNVMQSIYKNCSANTNSCKEKSKLHNLNSIQKFLYFHSATMATNLWAFIGGKK